MDRYRIILSVLVVVILALYIPPQLEKERQAKVHHLLDINGYYTLKELGEYCIPIEDVQAHSLVNVNVIDEFADLDDTYSTYKQICLSVDSYETLADLEREYIDVYQLVINIKKRKFLRVDYRFKDGEPPLYRLYLVEI